MPRNWNSAAEASNGLYTPDNFKQAMYQLVTHQCLYSRIIAHGVSYRLISEYRDEFEEALALMGLRLGFNDRLEFCFVTLENVKDTPMDKQETLFLLVLRQLYHTKGSAGDLTPEGDALVSVPELVTTYHSMTGEELESKSNIIRGLVKAANRKGLARIQEKPENDPQPFAIVILPAIAEVLSENAINRFGAALKASLVTHEASMQTTEEASHEDS